MICGSAICGAPIAGFGVPWTAVYVPLASWTILPNSMACITPNWDPVSLTPWFSVTSMTQVSVMRSHCTEQAWLDRDNVTEWVIGQVDSITGVYTPVTDLSPTTRAVLCIGDVTLDSATDPLLIWWTDSVTDRELPDGTLFTGQVLKAQPGMTPGLESGEYENCRIVLYDGQSNDGIVVAANIHFTVYDPCYQ